MITCKNSIFLYMTPIDHVKNSIYVPKYIDHVNPAYRRVVCVKITTISSAVIYYPNT